MKQSRYPVNWAEIRNIVLERDSYKCQYCGCESGETRTSSTNTKYKASLQIAHLDHDPENWDVSLDRLLTLCQPCHLKNDRDHSIRVIKQTLSVKRINGVVKDKLTKPQMKTIIASLENNVKKLEQELIARDLKIKHLLGFVTNTSIKANFIVNNECEALTKRLERKSRNKK